MESDLCFHGFSLCICALSHLCVLSILFLHLVLLLFYPGLLVLFFNLPIHFLKLERKKAWSQTGRKVERIWGETTLVVTD